MKLPNGGQAHEGARPAWQPIPAWWWMLAAAAAVVITAFVVTTWLLTIAGHAKPGTDRANSRLDAVRTGLAAGAGAGAAVGLMLAFRRQHHQEIATVLTDLDATERRITELYTKAVEQLGNDKAPVRLGGLYALERLAQDNPAHRQTIVNVICAYLRMPFSPTAPTRKPEPEATEEPGEPDTETETRTDEVGDTWQQERQVRLTAQRILAEHLRDDRAEDQHSTDPPSPLFWPDIRLDLTGATLIDFNLVNGVMADASFDGATFSGGAWFDGAAFSGGAGSAGRPSAATPGSTGRPSAAPPGSAGRPSPAAPGSTRRPSPAAPGSQGDLQRRRRVRRGGLHRRRRVRRGDLQRRRRVRRGGLHGGAWFDEATFTGDAWFGRATFNGGADALSFERAHVLSPGAPHAWPTGWCLGPDDSGGHTVVRANGRRSFLTHQATGHGWKGDTGLPRLGIWRDHTSKSITARPGRLGRRSWCCGRLIPESPRLAPDPGETRAV